MMSLSLHLEYEENVIGLLKNKIQIGEGGLLRTHSRHRLEGVEYEFDAVELSQDGKIKSVYEVKTCNAVRRNYNHIQATLKKYADITKANVYLVYLDEAGQLKIVPYLGLASKERKRPHIVSVANFSDFYTQLKKIFKDENDELCYFFRGHSKYYYESIPSIFRNNNIKYEDQMYHEAIRKNPSEFGNMSTFDQLVKMQHYELPTRLLDVTTNPLVALYFACKENENEDGELLIYSMMGEQLKYYDSDSVCILSNLVKLPVNFKFSDDKSSLVYGIQHDKPNFKGQYLKSEATKKVICVMPKFNNERIIRQQGAFFIFGMGESKDKPAQLTDEPIKIRIKAEGKNRILKELQILGINEATLFPETDKIMKQIKMEFSRDQHILSSFTNLSSMSYNETY